MAMRRPFLTVTAVAALVLVLALPFRRFESAVPDHRILPGDNPVRIAQTLLDREFQPNEVTPLDVLLTTEGPALTPGNIARLKQVHRALSKIPGIARVDSVFSAEAFMGSEELDKMLATPADRQGEQLRDFVGHFVSGSTVRFSAVSRAIFTSKEAQGQVHAVRAMAIPNGLKMGVGGMAALLEDLRLTISERTPYMLLVVGVVMFILLFMLFGSVTLPLKAMVMNSLSLTASYGAIVWVFQDGRFTELLGYTPIGFSDALQPLVMFAVVFGMSMDYEVLILTRVHEEYLSTGDNARAVATGLARTARLVTSAAALLVVVIGAFATSDIVFMKTLGVGMALAIALDATVVRAWLVPAAMQIMGHWNWYAPEWMRRWWLTAGFGEIEEVTVGKVPGAAPMGLNDQGCQHTVNSAP
jgi:RND superfamily putative drug exporter